MEFTKIQGAGNDFVVINNMELNFPVDRLSYIAKKLCKRKVSIGADALMVVDTPEAGGDFKMRFYNSDGSIGEMCGNGARCIARYAFENDMAGEGMTIETMAGDVRAWRIDKRRYKIKLNNPSIVKFKNEITVKGVARECAYVELGDPGVPHAVMDIGHFSDYTEEELFAIGKEIRSHSSFHKGANANLIELMGENKVKIKTFERGVEGFTLACGTGAGATAAALALKGILKKEKSVEVHAPGGVLLVELNISKDEKSVENLYLTGDTNIVAAGKIIDEDLII